MTQPKSILSSLSALLIATLSLPVTAADLTIKLTNLTNGIYFTPLLVAAHDSNSHLFQVGEMASTDVQAMAEGGNMNGLSIAAQSVGANVIEDPASGLLAPNANTTFNLMTNATNISLSLTAMMLPTNDGFVGLDSLTLPTTPGTYTYLLNAYDAGTEANDELITGGGAPGVAGIPADPGAMAGSGGTGVAMSDNNPTIHIHRGNLGDTNISGGVSDLDSRIHRWLNPVAQLQITVN